ncbi:MAG: VanZ family protein [Acetobacter sp.]|nr:VanZ family protein [Bacteroides sp.]MCM1341136.1 VanZ family protein [Acetobacter sp.]MCM1433530.1 VanZ family protein [Clostridiales bacterium]
MKYMIMDLIKTLYSSLPLGLIIAVFITFSSILVKEKNIKSSAKLFYRSLKQSREFRFQIYFFTYLYILLYRAVFGRESIYEPLSKVLGGWKMYIRGYTGLNYEDAFGNILVFIPYSFLILFAFGSKFKSKADMIIKSTLFTFLLSLFIEINQLIFSKGTFQISDLVLNTAAGLIGALIFILINIITDKINSRTN